MRTKLELGCGDNPFNTGSDWDRMDSVSYDCVTIVGDIRHVPVKDDYYEEIYSHWVIEHFHRNEFPLVINEWKRVLKPGGIMTHTTGNGEAINDALHRGIISMDDWNYLTFANNGTVEELHKMAFTPDYLIEFFVRAHMEVIDLKFDTHCIEDGKLNCPGLTIKVRK